MYAILLPLQEIQVYRHTWWVACLQLLILEKRVTNKISASRTIPATCFQISLFFMDSSDLGRMRTSGRGGLVLTPVFSVGTLTLLIIHSGLWMGLWGNKTQGEMVAGNKTPLTRESLLLSVPRSLKGNQASWWIVLSYQDSPDTSGEKLILSWALAFLGS